MEKIEEALWANYEEANIRVSGLENGSEVLDEALKERDNVRNELIKMEQIKSENRREKIRNYITVGSLALTTFVSCLGLYKTFKFDEVATPTSTLGRGILNGVVLKMFKK